MGDDSSIYCPPRAKWYSPISTLGYGLRRVLHLDLIRMPGGMSAPDSVLSFLVPGYSFIALGLRTVGRAVMIAYAVAAMVFLVALGYALADIAFGLMIAVHATSLSYLFIRWLEASTFSSRLGAACATLVATGFLLYLPAVKVMQSYFFLPLRVGEKVLVVWRGGDPSTVRRGDWVACRIRAEAENRVIVSGGYVVQPVLGVAGDTVRFTSSACEIKGRPTLRQHLMPEAGGWVVPEKMWFIWPRLAINNRNVNEAQISAILERLAQVGHDQYIGRAFRHWFGRRQTLT